MSEKKTPRITDILERLNASVKTAEEEEQAKDVITEDSLDDPELQDASANNEEVANDGIEEEEPADDAESLTSIAKQASLSHRAALRKEAALFGEIFADSVMGRINKYNEALDKTASDEEDLMGVFEEAYMAVLTKMASEEAYQAAADAIASAACVAGQVADAANTLAENVGDAEDDIDEEDDDADIYPESLEDEDEGEIGDEDEDADEEVGGAPIPSVVSDAYQNAMQAMSP